MNIEAIQKESCNNVSIVRNYLEIKVDMRYHIITTHKAELKQRIYMHLPEEIGNNVTIVRNCDKY